MSTKPQVIFHNTISLDGAVDGFEMDLALHYKIAGGFAAEAHLVGSATALRGIDKFIGQVPEETAADRRPPPSASEESLPYFVLVDSGGRLQGKLHAFRSSGHCRELIVLLSERTPAGYREHLQERQIPHHAVGADQVDLRRGLGILAAEHGVTKVLVDSGPTLLAALLRAGLVDTLSLVVAPVIVGGGQRWYDALEPPVTLQLDCCVQLPSGAVVLRYHVQRRPAG